MEFTWNQLLRNDGLSIEMRRFFRRVVKFKKSVLVIGNYESGRTNFLKNLGESIKTGAYVIDNQDELFIKGDTIRRVNLSGMRRKDPAFNFDPYAISEEVIVFNELRGPMAYDLIKLIQEGKQVFASIPANEIGSALKRLSELMVLNRNCPRDFYETMAKGFDYIVYVEKYVDDKGKDRYRIKTVAKLMPPYFDEEQGVDVFCYASLYRFDEKKGQFIEEKYVPSSFLLLER